MLSASKSSAPSGKTYVEDVFSTYLYTGNSSTQTITNGIDLAGKGGLVWIKRRTAGTPFESHQLYDTLRGVVRSIYSNDTAAQGFYADSLTAFNSNGFSIGPDASRGEINDSDIAYASWTFRKQPKFFDVVTYTGNGVAGRTVAHNLGSVPGCIMVKRTDTSGAWCVYHNSLTYANGTGAYGTTKAGQNILFLNSTSSANDSSTFWNNTDATSTTFSVGTSVDVNASGGTYVAYLYANNAGGFGSSGTDNVISCGFYVGDGTTNYSKTINLGWEPQFVLIKKTSQVTDTIGWGIADNMRGFTVEWTNTKWLVANTADAESTLGGEAIYLTNTGFRVANTGWNSNTAGYIYIAIRRGPMRVPTDPTKVFSPMLLSSPSTPYNVDPGFPTDFYMWRPSRSDTSNGFIETDRLRGNVGSNMWLTGSEYSTSVVYSWNTYENGIGINSGVSIASDYLAYLFRRAPGFFDAVCYTGNGVSDANPTGSFAGRSVAHNLGVPPELVFLKDRTGASGWWIFNKQDATKNLRFTTEAYGVNTVWLNAQGTSNLLYVEPNTTGATYVAYLFATCPGVSKVGSYTGNGSSQTLNCGFTAGSRFILIKRTDSTGDWYVWDTARGIVVANDPHLSLNSSSAEVTTDDSIDPDNSGFIVNQVSATNINVSSATYIYLAIA